MNHLSHDLNLARRSMGYLSAPHSAATALERNQLCYRALEASFLLWERGVLHYCPHANAPTMDLADIETETRMTMGLEVIRRCDWVLMLSDWGKAPECRREFNVAQALKIPVVYAVEEAVQLALLLDRKLNAA